MENYIISKHYSFTFILKLTDMHDIYHVLNFG